MKSQIYKSKIKRNKTSITITLPLEVQTYMQAGDFLFWQPVNGILQVSGHKNLMTIPGVNVKLDSFLPQ